jgi:hypothetical protein
VGWENGENPSFGVQRGVTVFLGMIGRIKRSRGVTGFLQYLQEQDALENPTTVTVL